MSRIKINKKQADKARKRKNVEAQQRYVEKLHGEGFKMMRKPVHEDVRERTEKAIKQIESGRLQDVKIAAEREKAEKNGTHFWLRP